MLLKYTLRNIFTMKARLFVLMFCIVIACFTAYLAFDFSGSVKKSLTRMGAGMYGDASYRLMCISSVDSLDEHSFDDAPSPVLFLGTFSITKREESRKEEAYYAVITDKVKVVTFSDMDAAQKMGLFRNVEIPGMGEIAIGERYSKKYGYQVGDTITLYDPDYEEVPLTVSSIFTENVYLGGEDAALYALINYEQYIAINGESPLRNCYIQVLGDGPSEEFEQYLNEKHRGVSYFDVTKDETFEKVLNNIVSFIYLIFVLVFILVIFVTVSFTEKIITERMSVIGTLRSVGMSVYKTTFILLFENVLYGLSGGIIALGFYFLARYLLVIVSPEDAETIGTPSVIKIFLVILGAVLIEVLVPLKEVLKAVKTSIRDIIFESRDSEYRVNYPSTIFGFVMTIAGVILGLFTNNIIVSILSLLMIIVGGGLFIRFVVRKVTWSLSGVFEKRNKPIAELAAKECGSKKPNSGNAILAVTTICATTAIFVAGVTFVGGVANEEFDTDIIVSSGIHKENKYDYLKELPAVESLEYLYYSYTTAKFNGKQYYVDVWRVPEGNSYAPFKNVERNIEKDEVVLDMTSAHHANAKVGDTITITFYSDSIFPIEKTLRVKQIVNLNTFGFSGKVILSKELYNEMFPKEVTLIAVKSNDIPASKEAISDALTGGEGILESEEIRSKSKQEKNVIYIGILGSLGASVVLTLVGISGNQVIGFIGRKKEYAMLHSCACDRASIIKMIWIENAMLFGLSVVCAGILSVPVIMIINHVFVIAEMGIYATPPYGLIFLSLIVLWFITMLTALSPIKSLKKMNTATEMKYE